MIKGKLEARLSKKQTNIEYNDSENSADQVLYIRTGGDHRSLSSLLLYKK